LALTQLPPLLLEMYEVREWRHATAILAADYPNELGDIVEVLSAFRLKRSHIEVGGGNKTQVSASIDKALYDRGWVEKKFDTKYVIDQTVLPSPTHKIDCFRNRVGFEIEWNNKDPFFDRDLNNFRLLFELRTLAVGVIVTRCDNLQDIFDSLGRGSSYGESTTHMSKLLPKIEGGGAGGCPLLVFGISKKLYVDGA
jgi:hypothetical protein